SHALVLRSLTLMRELSPDYLSRFMSHIDALLWLEQANGGRLAVPQDIVRAEGDKPRKAARGKPG
ncbi:DUF2894 domain-containing protein, partial [Aquabacterium sp.]|uniref:DUF2894 domain-containing protein n=1 Tax=Aquabacterium sp. TaxID=1872578 RepID=UPI002B78490B